jgi:xylulokinase
LAWVKRNEPALYSKIRYLMLPGDYIAARLTGEAAISESGLSEGILWNFTEGRVAREVLECFEVPTSVIPKVYPCFGVQGRIRSDVAQELGLPLNVPVTYRAGDQPNNAFSLKVLNPGEVGANAGTSGVVYGVADTVTVDQQSRVNTFLHVNSTSKAQRLGVLLCVNGAGALSRWVKDNFSRDYQTLDRDAANSPIGARGLAFLPFGNGAERILGNRNLGASLHGIELNIHGAGDVYRAAMEGIAAALCYGVKIMGSMGVPVRSMRAGAGNMFRSPVFAQALASMVGVPIELYDTDGAEGAARGAGFGAGVFSSIEDTFKGLRVTGAVTPTAVDQYKEVFARWSRVLEGHLR